MVEAPMVELLQTLQVAKRMVLLECQTRKRTRHSKLSLS
jgi:hypothetical protein